MIGNGLNRIGRFFSKKGIKSLFGILMIFGGITLMVFRDPFTYFPLIVIVTGILILLLTFSKINNRMFYIIVFCVYYVLTSIYNEEFIKKYNIKINLSTHQNKFYIVTSNLYLMYIDILLTWFTSKNINIDFRNKTNVSLNRSIPYRNYINSESLYDKGYSVLLVDAGSKGYILLIPLLDIKTKLKGYPGHMDILYKDKQLKNRTDKVVDSLEKL